MGNRNDGFLTPESPVLRIANYLILVALVVLILGPLLILLNISFKSGKEYLASSLFSLPRSFFNLENYRRVMVEGRLLLGFRNTALIIAVSVSLSIAMGLMVAYVLGRFEFHLKKLILTAFVLATIIPSITTQVATFLVIRDLHLYNTIFAAMLLYVATDVMQIYVFLQYVQKIPRALDESAMLEGASYTRIFASIIIPQMRPAIVTLFIIKAIGIYNDVFVPYLYMPKNSLRTVSTAIMSFSRDRDAQWNVMAAGILAAMLPTLLIYFFCQRMIVTSLIEGAVKG